MSTSSDSAEQFLRIVLDETEFSLKITGKALEKIFVALYIMQKDKKQSKGKTVFKNMIKEGNVNILGVKEDEMKIFAKGAESYGVKYSIIKDKATKNADGMVDVMIMDNDTPKVNRIMTRYNLSTAQKGKIEKEGERQIGDIQKLVEQNVNKIQETELETPKVDDAMIDDIFGDVNAEEKKQENVQSPSQSQTEQTKESQSENSSMQKTQLDGETKTTNKPSVKEDLKKCAEEVKAEEKIRKAEKNVIPIKAGKPKSKERSK